MGENYTSTSYAFPVDSNGTIINHPNKEYENIGGSGVTLIMLAFMLLFSVCIFFIVSLINRLIRWQEDLLSRLSADLAEEENAEAVRLRLFSEEA